MSRENLALVRTLYEIGGDPFSGTPDQVDLAFRDHLDEQRKFRLPYDYRTGMLRARAIGAPRIQTQPSLPDLVRCGRVWPLPRSALACHANAALLSTTACATRRLGTVAA